MVAFFSFFPARALLSRAPSSLGERESWGRAAAFLLGEKLVGSSRSEHRLASTAGKVQALTEFSPKRVQSDDLSASSRKPALLQPRRRLWSGLRGGIIVDFGRYFFRGYAAASPLSALPTSSPALRNSCEILHKTAGEPMRRLPCGSLSAIRASPPRGRCWTTVPSARDHHRKPLLTPCLPLCTSFFCRIQRNPLLFAMR